MSKKAHPKPTYATVLEYLDATGRSQADLADAVGVSNAHMSLIIRGLRQPSLDVALRLREETGVAIETFARQQKAS
ncbi:MAG: helix-turn-helix transcriptional regulator [Acidobacteria bacterium]|nr:helix-turn-helix transcriptional regulator [Acidobacteriota bacterium]